MSQIPPEVLSAVRDQLASDNGRDLAGVLTGLLPVSGTRVVQELATVRAELTGLGPLQPLAERPNTTDILVNGTDGVFIDAGQGLQRIAVAGLGSEAAVRALAVRLAGLGGRRLDDACPTVDARLPGAVRLHAVLPPIAADGTLISLRIPARASFTTAELVARGSIPREWESLLHNVIRSRAAFLVSGGTGCGKTTVLSALLGLADPDERVLLVEDVAELRPMLPHVVRLEARHANTEGAGAVDLAELVRHALRMRPDRLVVGECRGAEVRDLLIALNTGHQGGCGTVHANTARDVPARLLALGALAGMDRPMLTAQAGAALDLVIHLQRNGIHRRVGEIGWLTTEADRLTVLPAVSADDPRSRGPGWEPLHERLAQL